MCLSGYTLGIAGACCSRWCVYPRRQGTTPGCVLSYSRQVIWEGETFPQRQHRTEKLYTRVEFLTGWNLPRKRKRDTSQRKTNEDWSQAEFFHSLTERQWADLQRQLACFFVNRMSTPVTCWYLCSLGHCDLAKSHGKGMASGSKAPAVPTMLPFNACLIVIDNELYFIRVLMLSVPHPWPLCAFLFRLHLLFPCCWGSAKVRGTEARLSRLFPFYWLPSTAIAN